jgi:iron-sulfur cluster assembly protein
MLTLTNDAVAEIRRLLVDPDMADNGGLRIFDESGSLVLSLAMEPFEQDQVVDSEGARVFLDLAAAQALGDKTLDASTDPEGQVRFSLFQQGTSPA